LRWVSQFGAGLTVSLLILDSMNEIIDLLDRPVSEREAGKPR
jgi:hypothetical protein